LCLGVVIDSGVEVEAGVPGVPWDAAADRIGEDADGFQYQGEAES
jgi:hypothetical protein